MADSLIYDLCKAVGSMLLQESCLLHGVRVEAEKMRKNLKRIEAVLKAAEQREMEADVKQWISDLKDVAYDIEDVLDDWSIAQLQMQDQVGTSSQQGNKKPKGDQVCFRCIPTPSSCIKQTKSRHEIAHRIREINRRLDDIDEGRNKFQFPKSNPMEVAKREITTSFKESIVVASQDNVKVDLIEKLVHGDYKNTVAGVNHIPIISVIGMGGIGKTTLARLVYNDHTVRDHFSKVIWVCVSNTCNEMNVARAIGEGLDLKFEGYSTLQYVLSKIDDSIQGCKFLLVLDDVWEESERKWGAVLKCLAKGDPQVSRILMTTRTSEFSQKMRAVATVPVDLLSDTDAWSLFSYYAFSEDSNHCEIVEGIAKKLSKKCKGLPLALEVLGRHMYTKTSRSAWQAVLDSEIWATKFEDEVFNSLAFSYLELRSEAKRCFAFCSVFPKDDRMRKMELIRLWMAHGYLQGSETQEMEFLGEECFNSLVRRSFLQVNGVYSGLSDDVVVTMHDIVHDFARYISSGEIAILDPSFQMPECGQIYAKPRHLVLKEIKSNHPCPSFDLKALRGLFLVNYPINILKDLCSNKSYIRVLTIDSTELSDGDLEGIGKLVHLRLVRLHDKFSLTVLPEEICSLPYLQTLDLRCCPKLKSLPEEIGKLACLRHLLISEFKINSLPKGLGKLSSLQTLSYFPCSSSVDRKDCSSLEDLADLNNLRGHLRLKNLNQVAHVSEATAAQLHMKKQIQQLILEFGKGNPSPQSDVLEALEPAKENDIEFLEIRDYRGLRCPRWIGELRYMKKVVLKNVGMEVLPAGLGMLRYLEIFCIEHANGVKHVGVELCGTSEPDIGFFPKLTKLQFKLMSQWEHWEGPKEVGTIMPRLRRLEAMGCKALRTLPRFLEHVPLESLIVDSPHLSQQLKPVEDDDCPGKWRVGDALLPQTLKDTRIASTTIITKKEAPVGPAETALEVVQQQYDINFTYLKIMNTQRCLGWIGELRYLKEVVLENVGMEVLPAGLGMLRYLEIFCIEHANGVKHVGAEFCGTSEPDIGFFPKLTKLEFEHMSQWEHWEGPKEVGTIMPRLRHLKAMGCKALRNLPSFLQQVHLESLIVDSPHLQQVELVEDSDFPGKWRMGDVLLPQTLMKIQTASTVLAQKEAPGRHGETALEVEQQQQDINFNILRIMSMQRVPGWIMDLTFLKEIKLSFIKDECLPPLGLMCSLEELYIFGAKKVKKVGDEFLGTSNTDDYNREGGGASTAFTAFPRLKQLTFKYMSAWQEWEDPVNRNSNCHLLVIMPSLCGLIIDGCNRLKSLPRFFERVPLKELYVGSFEEKIDMPKIRNTIKDEPTCKKVKASSSTILAQPAFLEIKLRGVRNEWLCDWAKYCIRLKRLTLENCDEASLAGLEVLPSLEELELWGCDDVRRMAKEVLRISSLKKLELKFMKCLEELEDPPLNQLEDESRQHDISSSSIRSNLRSLSLFSCPKLKALPSFLKSVPLEELYIDDCTALETWWANETGQDWRNWTSKIPHFTFKGWDSSKRKKYTISSNYSSKKAY